MRGHGRVNTAMRPLAAGLALLASQPALAGEAIEVSFEYSADIAMTASGGNDQRLRYLDNVGLDLDADLEQLGFLKGARLHLALLGNGGARPNDGAGTLEGVDNIEVGRRGLRLFEAWLEKDFGGGSLRAGLYDLNSEFYATDGSALLIAPPFGIGSELATVGRNGPSIFPSSALAARLELDLPVPGGHVRVAAVNARAQTLGDPGGIDLSFSDGVLLIGEVGAGERLRASLGGWTLTRQNEGAQPGDRRPAGIYGLVEIDLPLGERNLTAFLRGGAARGDSRTFNHSAQVGLLLEPAFAGRESSAVSIGYHSAATSSGYRADQAAAGEVPWRREHKFEVTYRDSPGGPVSFQPDLQWIILTAPGQASRQALHATLRVTLAI